MRGKPSVSDFPFPCWASIRTMAANSSMRTCWVIARKEHITFTRSRPYRKNDSSYVEQKNYTVVRRAVGYARYDTPKQLGMLNELYSHLRLYTNYFQPVMKLLSKERQGAKVKRKYDQPKTPYQRVLGSPSVPDNVKRRLKQEYARLNPVQLKREITRLQHKLFKLAAGRTDLPNRSLDSEGRNDDFTDNS
jgi:hypothetical protein